MDLRTLSEKQSLCTVIKFIAALMVVNGHLFIFGNPSSPLTRLMNFGPCCVSLFFFLSGYGLIYSYRRKGDAYLKSFFSRRFVKLLIPLAIAYIITLPIYSLLKAPINWDDVFSTILWGGPYLKFSWYVTEIAVIYMLFYITMRFRAQLANKLIILSVEVLTLMSILFIANQPIWYIVSLPGFIAGIWYEYFEKRIISKISVQSLISITTATALVWFIAWQWHYTGGKFLIAYRYEFISMFLSAFLFPIIVIALTFTARITPPNLQITHSFYEVYLLQNAAMIIASSFTSGFVAYWILTMSLILGIAFVAYKIDTMISGMFTNTCVNIGKTGKSI